MDDATIGEQVNQPVEPKLENAVSQIKVACKRQGFFLDVEHHDNTFARLRVSYVDKADMFTRFGAAIMKQWSISGLLTVEVLNDEVVTMLHSVTGEEIKYGSLLGILLRDLQSRGLKVRRPDKEVTNEPVSDWPQKRQLLLHLAYDIAKGSTVEPVDYQDIKSQSDLTQVEVREIVLYWKRKRFIRGFAMGSFCLEPMGVDFVERERSSGVKLDILRGLGSTAVHKKAQPTETNTAEEWRISERLTAEDITSAVAVAIAKSGLTSKYERRDDNVVSHIIFDGHTKIYSVIVSQANGYWRLYEELPENYKEFGESKRQSISRVVQAIKKEIVQASDLSDYRAGIPSLTWPNPPNTTRFGPDSAEKVIGSEESATGTQAVFVPKRPADLRRWKATWKRIRPFVERGETVNELISLRQENSSPETLEKIIRAGEAGLLS